MLKQLQIRIIRYLLTNHIITLKLKDGTITLLFDGVVVYPESRVIEETNPPVEATS